MRDVGLLPRLGAALIDAALWFGVLVVVVALVGEATLDRNPDAAALISFGVLSAWFNYLAFCEWRWGRTLGKRALGIRVVGLAGDRINFTQASLRNVARLVDWLVIGPAMIAATKRHQRLGDKLAKTVVVRIRPSPAELPGLADGTARDSGRSSGSARATTVSVMAAGVEDGSSAEVGSPLEPGSRAGGGSAPEPGSTLDAGSTPSYPSPGWSPSTAFKAFIGGLILGGLVLPIPIVILDPELASDAASLAAQAVLGGTLIAVSLGVASGWKQDKLGQGLGRLGLRRFRPSALGVMLGTLFAYYVAAGIFATLVVQPDQQDIAGDLGVGDPNLFVATSAALLIVVVAPVSEELFFRGMLFGGLRPRFGLWPAALISGALFGLIHAPSGPTAVVPLAMLGVAFAWLYHRTGSLWPCILAHVINNSAALVLLS